VAKPKPDHEDAELVLRVYDLRREPVLLRNTEWVAGECPQGRQLFEVLRARVKKLMEARG